MTEHIAYWKSRDRTEWRYLAEFREIFPELATPAPIAAAAIARGEELSGIADLAHVPADLVLALRVRGARRRLDWHRLGVRA
jgi:hypothetical protein